MRQFGCFDQPGVVVLLNHNVDVQLTAVDAGGAQDAKLLNQIGFVSDDASIEAETVTPEPVR